MRKSFVALALLVGAATMLTTVAFAQESQGSRDEGVMLMNARMAQQQHLTKAARLGTSANGDTFWVGHVHTGGSLPFHVGVGPYRPGVGGSYDGMWDFDTYETGVDSMQGWVPFVNPNTRSSGTIADAARPWQCLDWGNRMNAGPIQGRTPGIVSAWHADNGVFPLNPGENVPPKMGSNSWTPLAGARSAWCGLRAGNDFSVIEDKVTLGGTGNHINGNVVIGRYGDGIYNTNKNFPGYSNQWDQILYRDVRVANGGAVSVSFLYETQMDTRANLAAASCDGWFDKDPLSMVAVGNFISASAAGVLAPVDSFMVYVGVPTNPTACRYSNNSTASIFDMKRRWFSEVIAIDKPYTEILSTFGYDSTHRSSAFTANLNNGVIQPMLDAQGAGGAGVIRIAFRSKTNANYADETNTGGSFNSTNKGAVMIDQVAITGLATSGFDTAAEINNTVELANNAGVPAVGQGYALGAWHGTGKPPKLMSHMHAMDGGGPSGYSALAYADLCGPWQSPIRQCNINKVIMSSTDHDLGEASGGAIGTPFKENRNGFISPTINLVTDPEVVTGSGIWPVNDCGLDRLHVTTSADWWIYYDMYSGIFQTSTQGNVWGNSILSYPTVQKNGATVWGDVGYFTGVWSNGDKQCFLMSDVLKPHLFTSNPSGIPDSCKLMIFREQRCITWGAPVNCSSTDGHYTDNVALCLPPGTGVADKISIDIWDWYNDAFPANQGILPGSAAFDTVGAYIQIARNNAINTGDLLRFSIPGDSIFITGQNATGTGMRMDCVFRVFPGPGNYNQAGNTSSGLRTHPFWTSYMADAGEFGKPAGAAGHIGGWKVDTWNSVRCDTVELNIFPANLRAVNLPGIATDCWMSTIHEGESASEIARFNDLGITKNRCFLNDPNPGSLLDHTNINCGTLGTYPPTWTGNAGSGYIAPPTTKEYTKIFPDGLLTAGSHVEYFFRQSHTNNTGAFVMCPDTNRISPQPTGSAWNTDGMRWEGISILPDRWKDAGYGGIASACMLVVDYADRRGAERVWVGVADTIGATKAAKYGAHNGWYCTAAYVSGDGSHDFSNDVLPATAGQYEYSVLTPMAAGKIAIYKHGGQPGSTWDLYNVKAAESSTTASAGIGSRLASRANMGYLAGKQSMQGPTPEMLRTYYNMLFLLSGNLNNVFFGAVPNRGSKDIEIVQDFMLYNPSELHPRGVWVMGDGFVEGCWGASALHNAFLGTNLALTLRDPSYYYVANTTALYPDLIPTSIINIKGDIYSVQNSCLFTSDVLLPETIVGGVPASYYQDFHTGETGPFISGVYAPYNAETHPYVTLVDGWDPANMFCRRGGNTVGRMFYFMDVLTRTFYTTCQFTAAPTVEVLNNDAPLAVDFLGNIGNNPMVAGGSAVVRFGLAKADRVEVKVYDVTGRLVKTLANRNFQAGEQSVTWDGSNDQGRVVARGVYFTQVKFINSRFVDAKKVTVLK